MKLLRIIQSQSLNLNNEKEYNKSDHAGHIARDMSGIY